MVEPLPKERAAGIDLRRIKNILVVRMDGIGDLVLTSPFLRELRRNLPDASITLVVRPLGAELAKNCPYVDRVKTFDPGESHRFQKWRRRFRAFAFAARHLWRERIDMALLPRWAADYWDGPYLSYFSRAPLRIGYAENPRGYRNGMTTGYDRLLTQRLTGDDSRHTVEQALDLLRFIGGEVSDDSLEVWLNGEDAASVEGILPEGPVIAIGIGGTQAKKKWPLERYAALGRWIDSELGTQIVILGGREESADGARLAESIGSGARNLCGRIHLRQSAAVLGRCRLYVGNDTGLVHLAAAMKTPIIVLSPHSMETPSWHQEWPPRFRPWRCTHRLLQPEKPMEPCPHVCKAAAAHCILAIDTDTVRQAVTSLLAEKSSRP